jgi:beta-galactosidase
LNNSISRIGALALMACSLAHAQTVLKVDASAPVPAPRSGHLHMGASTAPGGHTIGINNQYLTRDGHPWMPVMGEMHYSRVPAERWEAELQKMKTAGIDIVSTYVIWNHHEEQEGQFDWSGKRDLRRFVQLARKAGLDVVVRVGPWVHAEVRYGGIPDWVVDAMPTRMDDPQYLHYVERLYGEIGKQLAGLLWKDGGNVVGIQLENEYNLHGPGRGEGHILSLKRLALKAGLDVPLYTVTGWDRTIYPQGEVVPVFGGYPDEPWATSTHELKPKETYAFRFDSRVSGDLGAQTASSMPGTADRDLALTPFLGAEYGAGLPAMYRRRTLVSADDIASMLPVQLGSGVNLMGYYMFHGGRNPVQRTTMEESTLTGGYNDTPRINYDFNAPLGPDGQMRPVLASLRPFHYFMHDFGARLAGMAVRKPEQVPASATDLSVPRWSVRSQGDSAFVFFNNHVRQYPMAARQGLQFEVKLADETLRFPERPVDVADGRYFIWPVNLDLDGTRLVYASAQPVARLDLSDQVLYVFAATAGVSPELAFPASAAASLKLASGTAGQVGDRIVVRGVQPGTTPVLSLQLPGAKPVRVLVLTPEQVGQLAIGEFAGKRRLVLSAQDPYFAGGTLQLSSTGSPDFRFAVFPALGAAGAARAAGIDGVFQVFEARAKALPAHVKVSPLRAAQAMPAPMRGGHANAAMQPAPETFGRSAAWTLAIARDEVRAMDGALLDIDFKGDIARLFAGTRELDDWYFNGQRWEIDLKHHVALLDQPLTVTVLPLRQDTPIYLPREARPDFDGKQQVAELVAVHLKPVYHLSVAGK